MALKTDHQLILPGATSLSEACQQALKALDAPGALPHLHRLRGLLTDAHWLRGDEYDATTPHERVLARLRGWPDQQAPWAADQASRDGLQPEPGQAWAQITPCHWLMGHDHLTLIHPDELKLTEPESRALFDSLHTLFSDDGWQLHWAQATRWYAVHPSLAELQTASLDRLIGRNPDLWMPEAEQARPLKRLQAEVQMLFYNHPVNDARQAQGLLTVNSFWLSGCGVATADLGGPLPLGCVVDDTLRQALLRDDIDAWRSAWARLDEGPVQRLLRALEGGQAVRLTLCGERHAVALQTPAPSGWLGKLQRMVRPPDSSLTSLLAQL
jgi:hypothetical protein